MGVPYDLNKQIIIIWNLV